MDGVGLQILWSNLIGIVSEQARALQRIAFSPIVPRSRRSGKRAV
jgi:N-methylhydantoinase B